MASKHGVLDLEVFDYKLVFGTGVNLGLNKAERQIILLIVLAFTWRFVLCKIDTILVQKVKKSYYYFQVF